MTLVPDDFVFEPGAADTPDDLRLVLCALLLRDAKLLLEERRAAFELALRGLLGDGAPLSPTSVARLKETWQADKAAWDKRSLAGLEVVYLWVDGVYVKAGLEKEKACVFVAVAGLADGRKVIVALTAGHRESTASWEEFLRDLRTRGMRSPRLVCGDGNLGICGAVTGV